MLGPNLGIENVVRFEALRAGRSELASAGHLTKMGWSTWSASTSSVSL